MNRAEQCKSTLRAKGWTKGTLINQEERLCMLGAVAASTGFNLWGPRTYEWHQDDVLIKILKETIKEQFPERYSEFSMSDGFLHPNAPVSRFNDHPDTTFEDVETIFEKAAVRLEEFPV